MSATLEHLSPPVGPVEYTEYSWEESHSRVRWDTWHVSTAKVVMVFDEQGRMIERYRLRVDHDGGDEQS
jgi:hypothetical protein